jgi:branched-chain amino acid transport system substrate-binding protein
MIKIWRLKSAITRMQAVISAVIIVVAVVVGVYAYYISTTPPSEVKEIIVASIFPQSGASALIGIAGDRSVRLAAEDYNKAGGVKALGGAKFKVISVDSTSDPETGMSEAERLVTTQRPDVIIGCYASGITYTVSQVAEKYKIPMFTFSSAPTIMERGFKYLFRIGPGNDEFGENHVNFIADIFKAKGASLNMIAELYENSIFGQTVYEGVKKRADALGIRLEAFPFSGGLTDASPLVTKLIELQPDAVIVTAYVSDDILILKTMKEMNFRPKLIIGNDIANPNIMTALKQDSKYLFGHMFWSAHPSVPGIMEIDQRHREMWGVPIDPVAGEYYVALAVYYEILEKAGTTDPDKVREVALTTRFDPDTVVNKDLSKPAIFTLPIGFIDFDEKGKNVPGSNVVQLVGTTEYKYEVIWPERIKTGEAVFPLPPWS